MQRQALVGFLLTCSKFSSVFAHGKLTRPTPRDGISTGRAGLDENNPVSFEPGCTQENTCDAFVCREPVPNPNVVPANVVAGGQLDVAWSFTALHVGDCAVYISYDVEKPRNQQRFVKIANLPDCKSYTSKSITIPAVLPAGRAILRWDWVALHIWPTPELFVQCADIVIDSSSQASPMDLDSFPITNPPIYPVDGNDGVGYRNAFNTGMSQSMTGPSCIDNTINDCELTAPGTERNTDSRRGSVTPTLPTPLLYPTASPQPLSQPSPTAVPTPVSYPTAAPQAQHQPSPQPTPKTQCVSNHPTIDYSLSCQALVATCSMHSFCKLVATDGIEDAHVEPEPESEHESEAEQESEGESEAEQEPEAELEPGAEPEPEPASAPCIPIGNCGANDWCDQAKYEAWCQSAGRALRCPGPFCKTAANSVQLVQRRHLRVAKHVSQTVLGSSFLQQFSTASARESVCWPEEEQ